MDEQSKIKILAEWLLTAAAIFLTIGLVLSLVYFVFENFHRQKIYPNIYLGNYRLGGLTPEEAKKSLAEKADNLRQNGIIFYYENSNTTILPIISSTESELVYEIIAFDLDRTITEAYRFGRVPGFLKNLKDKLQALLYGRAMKLAYEINEAEIEKILKDNFSRFEEPAVSAALVYEKDGFSISEEKSGVVLDYQKAIRELKSDLAVLAPKNITIEAVADLPRVAKKDAAGHEAEAEKMLALAPLRLKVDGRIFTVMKDDLAKWLALKTLSSPGRETIVAVGLDVNEAGLYLREKIAAAVNREPVDAKFSLENGKVVEFQASRDGHILDSDSSLTLIGQALRAGTSTVELVIRPVKSAVKTQDVNTLGVREIIGTGHSNFTGSPNNRRHNIRVGADTLHGLLIKPDEIFSLVKALGEIDAKTGYLPELVIKGNKTIPEYGGGLCQISTTMFRAALATGLPIIERRNHSYRVSYYEPAGTDATIYSPKPDFRFQNDTGHYILIQSRIEGDELYFDLWGTPDGRVASQTPPVIYNIVRPGPTKYIETVDLRPGEKKCTEKSRSGASTYFDYTVSYPDGTVKEERFNSYYVPWREVCLLGVAELSMEKDLTATTTPAM